MASCKALNIAKSLGFPNVVTGNGDLSKFWILWKQELQSDIFDIHEQCLTVRLYNDNVSVFISGIYAICIRKGKKEAVEASTKSTF